MRAEGLLLLRPLPGRDSAIASKCEVILNRVSVSRRQCWKGFQAGSGSVAESARRQAGGIATRQARTLALRCRPRRYFAARAPARVRRLPPFFGTRASTLRRCVCRACKSSCGPVPSRAHVRADHLPLAHRRRAGADPREHPREPPRLRRPAPRGAAGKSAARLHPRACAKRGAEHRGMRGIAAPAGLPGLRGDRAGRSFRRRDRRDCGAALRRCERGASESKRATRTGAAIAGRMDGEKLGVPSALAGGARGVSFFSPTPTPRTRRAR